ncbi:MAG: hypothetical protein ABSG89_06340 [Bacteroidales bacterium]|jgi:hypothetical protein
MAKKNFDNLRKNSNLGGGLNSLLGQGNIKSQNLKESQNSSNEVPKTFTMLIGDYEFLKAYSRYKAFHSKSKYPLKRSLSDAINLLRKAHPEVAID